MGGCANTRSGGFDSTLPGADVDAIDAVLERWRAERRPLPVEDRIGLVDALRSDDELVRFMASNALVEITGSSLGYRWDAPEPVRVASIEGWTEWARTGAVPAAETSVVLEGPRR